MKSLICSIILLSSIIITTVVGGIYTEKRLVEFVSLIEETIPDSISEPSGKTEKIEQEYEDIKIYLILFTQKSELREIEMHIADMKSAAKSDDIQGTTEAKNRLILHIEQLRRLSTFNIESIF